MKKVRKRYYKKAEYNKELRIFLKNKKVMEKMEKIMAPHGFYANIIHDRIIGLMKFSDIGDRYGVSTQWANQIVSRFVKNFDKFKKLYYENIG